ncbi:hypothetical protein [Agrobacterium tumefaciens]|uniref:hypothetical protein n=1 Tax=Agrobacterium tumefaciens TaxID=358 RepID=UPI000975546E|nr:hypothetical protein BV900_22715 [Agrobacterium tumefaciens]
MTSPSGLLPTNDPGLSLMIACDFSGPCLDRSAFFLCAYEANGDLRVMEELDENDLARLTVEGIVPNAPLRPFEPNRFSKSRGRI